MWDLKRMKVKIVKKINQLFTVALFAILLVLQGCLPVFEAYPVPDTTTLSYDYEDRQEVEYYEEIDVEEALNDYLSGFDEEVTVYESDESEEFVASDFVEEENTSFDEESAEEVVTQEVNEGIREDGEYTSKDEVAEYIHTYNHLPSNFITKDEAKSLGWVSNEGNLGKVAPGKSIGGDYFGNYEGLLPKAKGRKYYECDIDFDGGFRGPKRIIYSNDGLIYYTEDHYETFELLYE